MKRRAPNIRPHDLAAILSIIDGWEEPPLSWKALITRVAAVLHATYTRQALHRYPEIAAAVARRRTELQTTTQRRVPVGDLKIAIDRLERLEAENRRLKAENDALLERFVRWAYNANLFGLDEGKLEQQTPPAGRS